MSEEKQEFIKRIIDGVYEVLDLSNYDFRRIDEVIEEVKVVIKEEFEGLDIDLSDSHYAYVVILLNEVEEWDTVVENLDLTIKEVLDKTYLDREARIIENEIIKVLVDEFGKDEKAAKELVKSVDIRKQIDGYSLLLHYSVKDWAISILTANEDYEAVEEYLSQKSR